MIWTNCIGLLIEVHQLNPRYTLAAALLLFAAACTAVPPHDRMSPGELQQREALGLWHEDLGARLMRYR